MTTDLFPAPAPPPRQKLFRSLARFAWMSFFWAMLSGILLSMLTAGLPPSAQHTVSAISGGIFPLAGILCGVIALSGVGKHGRKGILWPALIGIGLWVFLIGTTVAVFNHLHLLSGGHGTRLTPAVHMAGARRVQGGELGFSFEVPAGYEDTTRSSLPAKYQMGFIQRLSDEPARMIAISHLDGKIPHKHLQHSDLPPRLRDAALTTFDWRGLEIDAVRVLETSGSTRYVTFNVQIPLRRGGVQMDVSGPEEVEPLLRALIAQILSTFDGETNW